MEGQVSVSFMRIALCVLFVAWLMLQVSAATEHHHKWKINYNMSWWPDCVQANVISINGHYPGPTIRAMAGDTLVVELENQMPTENVVIHWHGIRQIGTPWNDGTASMSQCAIHSEDTYVYKFVVDRVSHFQRGICFFSVSTCLGSMKFIVAGILQPGTYFYHGHYGLQRSAGLYGSLIVYSAEKEPFTYDEELSTVLNDWWHTNTYDQAVGLSSIPFVFVGEPQSLLIEGRGRYNCSLGTSRACNTTHSQCTPFVLEVKHGKTYRLRIASVASLSALNFLIEGHNMTVVEADGHYVEPVILENLDVYSGESYSVLITTNQDPSKNYWAAVNVRGREPETPTVLALLNYLPNPSTKLPATPPPASPLWNDYAYSKSLSKKFLALKGHEERPPLKSDRELILLNTQNKIEGYTKWAINNISLVPPPTPYLAAMKYNIHGAYDRSPPPDVYEPRDYNITLPPSNPNAVYGNRVYMLELNSVVDVILRNANTLTANKSEIHPWHLHGHDFWILGYGEGAFDPQKIQRNTICSTRPFATRWRCFPTDGRPSASGQTIQECGHSTAIWKPISSWEWASCLPRVLKK
eukprot:Gb_34799 [translate_table: standard]